MMLDQDIARFLYDYQVAPANQLFRALQCGEEEYGYPGAADLSDIGTGKGAMDLAAMLGTGRKVTVLCPSAGENGWRKMFSIFGAEPQFIGTYEAVRMGVRPEVAVLRNGDFYWRNPGSIGLIADEAQISRNPDSISSRLLAGAVRDKIPMIVASATLAISPTELRLAGRVTGLHKGGEDWSRFLLAHGCTYDDELEKWVFNRQLRHLEAIHRVLIPERGCRVRKNAETMGEKYSGGSIEVLPIEVPEGPEIQREWMEAQNLLAELRKQRKSEVELRNIRNRVRMRIWHKCERVLVPHVAERMKRNLAEGKSVVAFVSFDDTRRDLCRLMGTHDGFHGGQNAAVRKRLQDAFQADRIRVLINNIGAGGASVSLHDVRGEYPRESYIFTTDHPVKMGQAPGRIDRAGGLSPAVQWIPCVAGTLTEQMVASTARKLRQTGALNDGDNAK